MAEFACHANDRMPVDFGPKSARTYDPQNGFLHVRCHISKACINPYRGIEIPGHERLGLDPDRIYQLFRDPKELSAAAETFHNLPLMSGEEGRGGGHPSGGVKSSDEHLIKIGSISNPQFSHPYLDADVVVWNDTPIAGIETDTARELSSSYGYTPVMEPGEHEGQHFDGRMTAIHGNHVALVPAGRAGPDVIVGDAEFEGDFIMPVARRQSTKSVLALGAITGFVAPRLAADGKLDATGIATVLKATSAENWLKQKPRLATAILDALGKTKLAADAKPEDVHALLDSLDGVLAKDESEEDDDDKKADDEEDDKDKDKDDKKADDQSEEDDDDDKKKAEDKAKDKQAMDSAIRVAVAAAEKRAEDRTIARLRSIRQAEEDVLPHVGAVAAMDSAEEIYRFALGQAGVEHADIKEVPALRRLVGMIPKPGAQQPMAHDSYGGGGQSGQASDAWLKTFGVAV